MSELIDPLKVAKSLRDFAKIHRGAAEDAERIAGQIEQTMVACASVKASPSCGNCIYEGILPERLKCTAISSCALECSEFMKGKPITAVVDCVLSGYEYWKHDGSRI